MRKFAENKHTNRQSENTQSDNSKTEATLIPCGSWGGAGQQVAGAGFGGPLLIYLLNFTLKEKSS